MIEHIHSPGRVLIVAFLLGLAFNALFLGHSLGVSVPIYILLILASLNWLGRRENQLSTHQHRWLYLPLIFLAVMVAIRANSFLTFLNVTAIIGLLSFIAYYFNGDDLFDLTLFGYPFIPLVAMFHTLGYSVRIVPEGVADLSAGIKGGRNLAPIGRGLLLAGPILLIFTVLLASADLVFADWLRRLFSFTEDGTVWEWGIRTIVIIFVTTFWAGGFAYAFRLRDEDELGDERTDAQESNERVPLTPPLGFIESATILSSVNLLFVAFGIVQFAYLFGGLTYLNIEDFSYATYARRGFFELVTVSLLTLALILGLNWLTRRENKREMLRFNALSSVMVVLVLVLLSSASYRLSLYELAFGFTELRLYSHVFMIWLAALFLWFLVTLWKRPHQFTIGIFVAALGFVATLNLINPDAFITRHNINRYLTTGEITLPDPDHNESARVIVSREDDLDTAYLFDLSYDAIPELVRRFADLPANDRAQLRNRFSDRLDTLESQLAEESWPSFHWSKWRAYRALQGLDLYIEIDG